MNRRRRLLPVLLVFAAALLVRGVYLFESRDNPTFRLPVVDARTYDQMARDLVEKGKLSQDFYWQPPFYPFFLSGVYALTGGSMTAALAIQAVVGALTAILAFGLGARLFGRAAGVAAGLITAVYMPLVFFEADLVAAGWAAFFALALVLAFLRAAETPSVGRIFLVGLGGVLGVASRPELFPFLVAGLGWLIIKIGRRRNLKAAAAALAPAVAGFLLVAVPVGFIGRAVTGKFRLLPFSAGVNFFIGNNPESKKTVGIRPGYEWHKLLALPEKFGLRDINQKEAFFRKKAMDYVIEKPLGFMGGLVYKTRQFFTSREINRNVDIYVFRRWSQLLRIGVWKWGRFGFPFGLLLALAAVGAAARARSIPGPVWLFLAFYPAAVILVFVSARYRVPYVPMLAVLASGGAAALIESFKKDRRRLIGLTAFFTVVLAAGSISAPFPEERQDYRAELSYLVGASLQTRGRLDEAAAAYQDAVSRRSDYADAWYNLGVLKEKEGNPEAAILLYLKAVESDPDYSDAFYNLGVLYQAGGRPEEAQQAYLEAVRIMPSDIYAQNNLGTVLRSTGDLDGAILHYELALKIHPGFTAARNNFGYALSNLGRWDAAAEQFRRVLEIEPDSASSLIGLSRALTSRPNRVPNEIQEAILLADRAVTLTGRRDPRVLRVLAEACAAGGEFGRAAAVARAAADLAAAGGSAELAAELRALADRHEQQSKTRR